MKAEKITVQPKKSKTLSVSISKREENDTERDIESFVFFEVKSFPFQVLTTKGISKKEQRFSSDVLLSIKKLPVILFLFLMDGEICVY